MQHIIIRDCLGRHHTMSKKSFLSLIEKESTKGPIEEYRLDDIYEAIDTPIFDTDSRNQVCKAILDSYYRHLANVRISAEQHVRVLKFWWMYRENEPNDPFLNDYISRSVTRIAVPSKTLPKAQYDSFVTFFNSDALRHYYEVKSFNDLKNWVCNLEADFCSLLHETEVNLITS